MENNYACKFCEKTFTTRRSQIQHEKIYITIKKTPIKKKKKKKKKDLSSVFEIKVNNVCIRFYFSLQ